MRPAYWLSAADNHCRSYQLNTMQLYLICCFATIPDHRLQFACREAIISFLACKLTAASRDGSARTAIVLLVNAHLLA